MKLRLLSLIVVLTISTSFIKAQTVSTFVNSSAAGLTSPFGLAFDASGNLYVSNMDNSIRKITHLGVVFIFVSAGLNAPEGLAFDASGNLYVANNNDNSISKVTPAGVVSTFVSTGLYKPAGLAFDAGRHFPALHDLRIHR